jgi:eukaryotic-like serine/threonine-protein kinase
MCVRARPVRNMRHITAFILLATAACLSSFGQATDARLSEWKSLRLEGARQFDLRNWDLAETRYIQALAIARAGANPSIILRTLQEFGILSYRRGRLVESKRYFEEALVISQSVETSDVASTVLALNYIGLSERDLGHYGASVDLHRRALELLSKHSLPDKRMMAETEFALAVSLHGQGRHMEAQEHYQKALRPQKDGSLGLKDFDLARVFTSLARLAMEQSDLDSAKKYVQRADKILRASFPSDRAEWIDFLDVSASLMFCERKYTDAERRWQDARALGEKQFGALHPNVLVILGRLGEFYLLQGEDDKALEYLSKCMEGREIALGKDHPDLAFLASQIALLQTRKQQFVKAGENYDRALRLLENSPGANQLILAMTLHQKGDFHAAQKAWGEAVASYERSLGLMRVSLGENHPMLAQTLSSCAIALRKSDRKKDAKVYEERAKAIVAAKQGSLTLARHTVDVRSLRAESR